MTDKKQASDLGEATRIIGKLATMPHKPHKVGKKVAKSKPKN